MGKILFCVLAVIFFLHGAYFLYGFSPWGPAHAADKLEILSAFTFLGFPASFLCLSLAYRFAHTGKTSAKFEYWQLAAYLLLSFLSLWLTMIQPWNLITRVGAAAMAIIFAVLNFLRAR